MSKTVIVNGVTITMETPEERLSKLCDLHDYPLRVMLYGVAKSGKSTLASKFPTPKGVIDLDNGAVVYKGNSEIWSINEDSILPIVGKTATKPSAWEFAVKVLDQMCTDPDLKCIVVDSMTSLSDACLKHIMAIAQKTGQQPGFTEWARQMDQIKEFIFKAFSSGKSVVTIWHEETEKDEQTGQLWCQPMATGKLSKKAPMWFDEVYHTEVSKKGNDTIYQIRTRASSMYRGCGSRLSTHIQLPDVAPAEWVPILEALNKLRVSVRLTTGKDPLEKVQP